MSTYTRLFSYILVRLQVMSKSPTGETMPAPEIIHQLVTRFTEDHESCRSGKYIHSQLWQVFLNPLLAPLGWDIYNYNDC
jgi:hypothetical protein